MSVTTKAEKCLKKRKGYAYGADMKTQIQLHAMLLPGNIMILLFNIVPLFGLLIAFNNFRPVMGWNGIFTADWNNFCNFRQVFRSAQFWPMLRNTVGINLLGQLITIPGTILFALLLNELTSRRFKSAVQTLTYMPHFLSWAIYGGLVVNLLSADGGMVNTVLQAIGILKEPVVWLGHSEYFWWIAIFSGLIKELGWGAIIYLAAISGIDPTLYEAAAIDGATRAQKMIHVTLPSILPTVMIMIIFAISGMLNNNFTQIYVLQNALNMEASQVIDTYVYQIGMKQFQFGVATAASLTKSVFALALLSMANFASKKLTDTGLY